MHTPTLPFSEVAAQAIRKASEEAVTNGRSIATEDILIGLVIAEGGVPNYMFTRLGIDTARIRAEIQQLLTTSVIQNEAEELQTTTVLTIAEEEAIKAKQQEVGSEHILLGLLRENDGIAKQILMTLKITEAKVRDLILEIQLCTGFLSEQKFNEIFCL